MSCSRKIIILQLLIFSFGCAGTTKDQDAFSPTAVSPTASSPTPEGNDLETLKTKWNQMTGDVNERIKGTEETLKKDSKTLGIENLKDKKAPADFELRIWSDQETLLHCLLISNKDGKWEASMLTGDLMLDRRTGYQYLKKTKSLKNFSPKSGWKEISDVFSSRGIRFPFSYKIDEVNMPPEPDEGLVKVELRSDKQYGLAFYQKLSDSDDAKKIIELCRWLQDEFDIDLGC